MSEIPVLVCVKGALQGQQIPIRDGGLGLGRSSDNEIMVEDEGVSRFHARLLFDNGSLWLQDAGSRNGVFVNDVRITGHKALKVGDVIAIAEHVFELRWLSEAELAQNAPPESGGESPESTHNEKPRRWFWPFS